MVYLDSFPFQNDNYSAAVKKFTQHQAAFVLPRRRSRKKKWIESVM